MSINGLPPSSRPRSLAETTAPASEPTATPTAGTPQPSGAAPEATRPAATAAEQGGARQRASHTADALRDAANRALTPGQENVLGQFNRQIGPARVSARATEQNGVVTATLEAGVGVERSRQSARGRGGAGFSANANLRAEVAMPAAQYAQAVRDGTVIDPSRPQTIPEGTRVTLEQSHGGGVNAERTGRRVGLGGSYNENHINRVELERLPNNRLRVTTTRTDEQNLSTTTALPRVVSPSISDPQNVTRTQVRSAEFDLGTAEGRAAFDRFSRTGTVPQRTEPGVHNVTHRTEDAHTQHLNVGISSPLEQANGERTAGTRRQAVTSQTDGEGANTITHQRGGSNALGLEEQREGQTVRQPDGSFEARESISNNAAGVPLTIHQTSGADGREDPARRRYEFSFPPGESARIARMAFEGADPGHGQGFRVELTRDQMAGLHQRVQEAARQNPADPHLRNLSEARTPDELARAMARYGQGQSTVANVLYTTAWPSLGAPVALGGRILPPQ